MRTRTLAMALLLSCGIPTQQSVQAEGWSDNPVIVLGLFAGAGFALYKTFSLLDRRSTHSNAIKTVNEAKVNQFLSSNDAVSLAKTIYGSSGYPLVKAYTHLTEMKGQLECVAAQMNDSTMQHSYGDAADLHNQAHAGIAKIAPVLMQLESADGFKEQLDRYLLTTVPSIERSIDSLREMVRDHHCHCN